MVALTRRVDLTIEYLDRDISNKINNYVAKVITIDNYEGIIDSLKIELLNKDNVFLKPDWAFKVGERVKIGCKTLNWEKQEGEKYYLFGEYYIDEREIEKDYCILKGLSIPLKAKDTVFSKTWNEITLEELGNEFARKYDLKLKYLVESKITLTNLSQKKQTDFSFLKKIAEEENIMIKIAKDNLILFEDDEMEKSKEVLTLDLNRVEGYSFKETSNTIYDSVEIKYFDTMKSKQIKEKITVEELEGKEPGEGKKPLKITSEYKNKSKNFKIYALKKLKMANKKNEILNIKIIGKPGIYSGQIIKIINSGILNGRYMMLAVKQSLPNYNTVIGAYKL